MATDDLLETFVFLHLNTTCLPNDGLCRITEICMMALDRESFKEKIKKDDKGKLILPRVVNKLVLCLDPDADITREAQDRSELSKDLLLKQEIFSTSTVSLIKSFLAHLKKPYCLIAHNGNKFDFQVLKNELERIHAGDFEEFAMYCADSLIAVRELAGQNEPSVIPMKRSRTEPAKGRDQATTGKLKRVISLPTTHTSGRRQFGAREYFADLFGYLPENSHTAEGFCKALVHILQDTPGFRKWVDKNKTEMADM